MNLKRAKALRKMVRSTGLAQGKLERTKDGSLRYPVVTAQRMYHGLKRLARSA